MRTIYKINAIGNNASTTISQHKIRATVKFQSVIGGSINNIKRHVFDSNSRKLIFYSKS